jgi:hypothetical protein
MGMYTVILLSLRSLSVEMTASPSARSAATRSTQTRSSSPSSSRAAVRRTRCPWPVHSRVTPGPLPLLPPPPPPPHPGRQRIYIIHHNHTHSTHHSDETACVPMLCTWICVYCAGPRRVLVYNKYLPGVLGRGGRAWQVSAAY